MQQQSELQVLETAAQKVYINIFYFNVDDGHVRTHII
jgi:hypothetical protein